MMNKKLLLLLSIFMSFGLQAMRTKRSRNGSLLRQVATDISIPDEQAEVKNTPIIVRPKACKFPVGYATRIFVTQQEWSELPPAEQEKWIWDQFMPDECKDPFTQKPESVQRGHRTRIEIVQKRFQAYKARCGYVDTSQ